MKKYIFLLTVIGLCFSLSGKAQEFVSATAEQKQLMSEKISESSAAMIALVCDFVQKKELSILNETMISKGKMYYRNDSRLRWEYFTPYSYTFVLNGKKILMKSDNSQNVIDVNSSKLFQEIVKIMMSSVSGTGLIDNVESFSADYFWGDKACQIHFVPKSKEMKKMFSNVKLTFDKQDYTVDQVEMTEQTGSVTVIKLANKQINTEIGDEKFRID